MPIYEYYSPDTNKIYSFYAKTLAQGQRLPRCPDNPRAKMVKLLSAFSIGGVRKEESADAPAAGDAPTDRPDDPQMNAAMDAMEREFSNIDENDPRALARVMRRMAELGGEQLDEPMEEVVRKLEEGADPDALEEQLGDAFGPEGEGADGMDGGMMPPGGVPPAAKEGRAKFKVRRPPPVRDPKLYDYE